MYHLQNFLGNRFDRIQAIIDNEHSQMNLYANLIGSANYSFPSVLEALNTPFNLNPSEGSRRKRYFPQCNSIDELENIAESLLIELFQCKDYGANIEPYSGTQANHIVYQAILKNDDAVLVMRTSDGGHVSHYHYLKTFCNVYDYGVNKDEEIDYEEIERKCQLYHPKLVIAGASSYPRNIDYKKISAICKKYNAYLLADISHTVIYIMNQTHISPFDYADFVTFTTHKTTRGIRGGIVLYKKEFESLINRATFPIVQGAPKFNELLAKTIMLCELKELDIQKYVKKILEISQFFSDTFTRNSIELYTKGTDSHLLLLNLRKHNLTGKYCEDMLLNQHILTNRNQVPNDNFIASVASGLRIGILTLATLDMPQSEYSIIASIIAETILKGKIIDTTTVSQIMKYYKIIDN